MNYTLSKVAIFIGGAVIGSVVTWRFLDERYKRIVKEEIDSVKEVYSKRNRTEEEDESIIADDECETSVEILHDYTEVLQKQRYTNYANTAESTSEEKEEDDVAPPPYVIAPKEFGENDYPCATFFWWADNVLSDDDNYPVIEPDIHVGTDFMNHFGEYEDDSVYIRNDDLQTDFEILRELRSFKETYPERYEGGV